jgi:hypothetical protein
LIVSLGLWFDLNQNFSWLSIEWNLAVLLVLVLVLVIKGWESLEVKTIRGGVVEFLFWKLISLVVDQSDANVVVKFGSGYLSPELQFIVVGWLRIVQ